MDAETLSHAFEPFFTTKDVGKGTGLGLATVYGIVRQFEGTIQIESEAGQGTSVSVQLPEFVSAAPGDAAIVRPEGGPARTIVVVDDDPQVCAVVAARLRLDAYRVLEATDGEEALRILEREGYEVDLVISDLIMPIKSGPELVAEIAAQHPRVKFILMSGYLSSEAAGVETGDQQTVFLRKPVRMEELSETVRGVLAGAD
jgi:CheY-like chemotaxis protein